MLDAIVAAMQEPHRENNQEVISHHFFAAQTRAAS